MAMNNTDRWEDKREKILNISINMFSNNGYKGTTLQGIADVLNMRRPSILYYFKNKELLLDEIICNVSNRILAVFRSNIYSRDGSIDLFSALDAVTDFLISNPSYAKIIMRQAIDPQFPRSISNRNLINSIINIIKEYHPDDINKYIHHLILNIFLTSIWISIANAVGRSMCIDILSKDSLRFLQDSLKKVRI